VVDGWCGVASLEARYDENDYIRSLILRSIHDISYPYFSFWICVSLFFYRSVVPSFLRSFVVSRRFSLLLGFSSFYGEKTKGDPRRDFLFHSERCVWWVGQWGRSTKQAIKEEAC
jgi:hypothetical protein